MDDGNMKVADGASAALEPIAGSHRFRDEPRACASSPSKCRWQELHPHVIRLEGGRLSVRPTATKTSGGVLLLHHTTARPSCTDLHHVLPLIWSERRDLHSRGFAYGAKLELPPVTFGKVVAEVGVAPTESRVWASTESHSPRDLKIENGASPENCTLFFHLQNGSRR